MDEAKAKMTYNKTSIEQDIILEVQKATKKQNNLSKIMMNEYKSNFGKSSEIDMMLYDEVSVNNSLNKKSIK